MVMDYLLRKILGFFIGHRVLSIGTKYMPTNSTEREYVDMLNYTKTMLIEIERAHINTSNIFDNLTRELGTDNIPKNRKFIELKPAENRVDEYALLSNIIMGSDRYLYIEVFNGGRIMDEFVSIIEKEKGRIIEKSSSEILARFLSKNDAIRVAIKLIGAGSRRGINVRAAAGMTGAAAIERAINLNREIGEVPGVGFTKLGGEFAIIFTSEFEPLSGSPSYRDNYLFIDMIDSTGFIERFGRDSLVEIMNDIKTYMENDCRGKIEGYREGGDDLIANFPTKDMALRAGIDSAWHAMDNGANIRVGIGKTRREAGERAQIADSIKLWNPTSIMIFDVADGIYGYFIPSPFTRSVIDFLMHKKSVALLAFVFVFIATFLGWNMGHWEFGIIAILLAIIYAATA
ncbi:hypothetical protein [Methanothermobacter sp.]|uniref:hypothetical protein n=1 Tax=Methanothermobacter sp. TaxID=1884223 RepID=UPI003C740776